MKKNFLMSSIAFGSLFFSLPALAMLPQQDDHPDNNYVFKRLIILSGLLSPAFCGGRNDGYLFVFVEYNNNVRC